VGEVGVSEVHADLSRFAEWQDCFDCEKLHWEVYNQISSTDGALSAIHPKRNFKKNIGEIFPLVLLGKKLLGKKTNWDMSLKYRFNVNDELIDGKPFDAEYKFISYQPNLDPSGDRGGFLEVTRALDEVEGLQEKLRDEVLYAQGWTQGHSTYEKIDGKIERTSHKDVVDFNEGLIEIKKIILGRIREKSAKTYPSNTSLIVWLFNENNPHNSPVILSDKEFLTDVDQANADRFKAIYLIGVSSGCHLLFGQDL
jgi:hypothetical protein